MDPEWCASNPTPAKDESGNIIEGAVNITDSFAFSKEMEALMDIENEIPFEKIKFEDYLDKLGCSFEELKTYLESKFEDWMTWENYGTHVVYIFLEIWNYDFWSNSFNFININTIT